MRPAVVVAFALLIARVGAAQAPAPAASFEARMDGILARHVATTHIGLGVTRRMSRNLELQLVAGGGVTFRDDDARSSARADVLARFAPAPSTPNAWGAYASGGVSGLFERGDRGRAVLALLVGVRQHRTFIEVGLGGGLRVGAGLRF